MLTAALARLPLVLCQVDTALIFPVACCAAVVLGVGYKINSYFAEKKRVAEVQRTGIGRGAAGKPLSSQPSHIRARPPHPAYLTQTLSPTPSGQS